MGRRPFLGQALHMMADAWTGDIAGNLAVQASSGKKAADLGQQLMAMGIRLGPDEPWRGLLDKDRKAAIRAALPPAPRPTPAPSTPITTLGRIFRALAPRPDAPSPAPVMPPPPDHVLVEMLGGFKLAQSVAEMAGQTAERLRAYLPRLQAIAQGKAPTAPLTETDLAAVEALVEEFGDRPAPQSPPATGPATWAADRLRPTFSCGWTGAMPPAAPSCRRPCKS